MSVKQIALLEISLEDLTANCEQTSKLLKSLAHPQRLQVLCLLSQGRKTVGELESLCRVSQSSASQFLARLKSEGLITSERQGQFVYYRILDVRVLKLIRALHKIFCP
jgi:DNA-binding transcriptional ArsR family regulator